MSYLAFHLVFILPPLLVLLYLVRRAPRVLGPRAWWTLPVMALIAFVYTTPWDNYLIYRGIWWYGPDRVLGTIGYVPVEEYAFFLLQPLLTGGWTYLLLMRAGDVRATDGKANQGLELPGDPAREPPSASRRTRFVGVAGYLLLALAGAVALTAESWLYMGLILAWAAPVLAAQWYFAGHAAAAAPARFVTAVGVPTLYLWVADRIAIGQGIWTIAPQYTTGVMLFGLPVEEALFFLVTNLLVVQGVYLFLQPGLVSATATATTDRAPAMTRG